MSFIPHFNRFPLFTFSSAGAVDKIVLPDGMQSVNFAGCKSITGTADLGRSEVYIYLICFEASRTRFLIPHNILSFPPFFLSPASSSLYAISCR